MAKENGTNFVEVTKTIDQFLSEHKLQCDDKDLTCIQCLNEAWFSNILAWLLDPRASHGLGVSFGNEFLKTVAMARAGSKEHARKKSLFKWGKRGRGSSSVGFSLKNASVIREFYLAKAIGSRAARGPRYCDIALFDLDSWDSLFVVIENKLFSTNHPGQLTEYYTVVEDKFERVKVREYVYLTLYGSDPAKHEADEKGKLSYWVNVSWSQNILGILEKLQRGDEHKEITRLRGLLKWLKELDHSDISTISINNSVDELRRHLVQAASCCLHAELQRLGDGKPGSWQSDNENGSKKSTTITHSSSPAAHLHVELLPNLSVTVQSRKKGKPLYEKIIVPYCANTDQIYDLFDISAREIYRYHFKKRMRYLSNKRRLRKTRTEEKKKTKPVFDYFSRNQHALRVLLAQSPAIKQKQKNPVNVSHGDGRPFETQ
ncbi:MAG TPA: PD-(D/E)XK nuclease family protein [Thermodesulfobacteriota bacterium]|nr:PD-(D/E)XK nuclease family protein [Thermodesulfobacteriota bacterium]HOC38447.1 PD-(D/E)XK nuclease family protein [Thermodesulfobacteriota bacterium]HQO76944.1 PD-(D/E)XK nuclease family protein [Thermodesulfobacteriota bacterium]